MTLDEFLTKWVTFLTKLGVGGNLIADELKKDIESLKENEDTYKPSFSLLVTVLAELLQEAEDLKVELNHFRINEGWDVLSDEDMPVFLQASEIICSHYKQ